MTYLYLFYGAVFFATGVLLGFQARLSSGVLPRTALWWFSGFAVIHAFSEWVKMAALAPGNFVAAWLRLDAIGLRIVSFALLAQFGIVVLRSHQRSPRWSLAVPGMMLLGWVATATTLSLAVDLDDESLSSLEAASRYALALPAALLAARAFWVLHRDRPAGDVIGRYLGWASGIFVAYAILVGIIVPPAAFFPASHVNSSAFLAIMHLPIEIPRMVCAVGIAVMLSEALVIEVARQRGELDRRREEFISIVAHDLRNPIGTIGLSTELLAARLGEIDETSRGRATELLQNIRTGAYGLERMVRDLLDASRIETNRLALETCDIDLRSLVSGIVDRVRQATEQHVVTLVVPETLPMVHSDPLRVEQILVNLLSNATKYADPKTEITVEATVHPDEIELAVTNRGSGLSPDDMGKVFSRFYRSEQHSRRIDGLGLGLYIAKGLVEAQGGRIWIDSEVGRYATFRFTLPCAGARQEASPAVSSSLSDPEDRSAT
jgi:signal transduction histidine kinase